MLPTRILCIVALAALAGSGDVISASQRPRAVAYAAFDPVKMEFADTYTVHIGPDEESKSWTLLGSGSHDPDGDSLAYLWDCENRAALVDVDRTAADLRGNWPEGEHHCTLAVSDGDYTSTDTVTLKVKVDRRGPIVTPPDAAVIAASETSGARPVSSAELREWLDSVTAVDDLGGPVRAIGHLVEGQPLADDRLFPLHAPTTVTFRFADAYDNVGEASATVTVKDLRYGDVFVATTRATSGGSSAGRINRVRDGVASVFCETPAQVTTNPLWWGTPQDLIVDSQGRVVFLANLPSGNSNFPHRGLFYCDFPGDLAHLIAVYPGTGTPREGSPVHYPDILFGAVNGLHLETIKTTVIDDSEHGGAPQTITQDAYVFSAHTYDRSSREFIASRAFRYLSRTGTTEDGPEIVPVSTPPPDMTSFNGDTYSAGKTMVGRTGRGFRFDINGSVAGAEFGLSFRLNAGLRAIGVEGQTDNYLSDDLDRPDYPTDCPGGGDVSSAMPSPKGGPHIGFTALDNIVMDARFGGMVLTSSHFGLPFFMTGVQQFWLDDDPLNDGINRFTRYELGCQVQTKIGYRQLPSGVRRTKNLVVGPDGIYGDSGNEVVRIRPNASEDETVYVGHAIAIGVWPPQKAEISGTTLVVRIDSPAAVVLTDESGRRLGVDGTGQMLNDFGDQAVDTGAASQPRFYIVKNPDSRRFELRSGAPDGSDAPVHLYWSDLAKNVGAVVRTRIAAGSGESAQEFVVDESGALRVMNEPPIANAGSDVTFDATANSGAVVSLNGTASSDPEGRALTYRWFGPFGSRSGAIVEVPLPLGAHTITLQVEDDHGVLAADNVVITVERSDTTPPVLTATRTSANAHGWNSGDVIVTFSCTDTESDIAVPPVSPVVIDGEGRDLRVSASCEDAAGNRVTLDVGGIHIDRTPPQIFATSSPPANEFGWRRSSVEVRFACDDTLSGVDGTATPERLTVAGDGAGESVSGSCRDRAGNMASTTVKDINIDMTSPTISAAPDRAPNEHGWYNADVTVRFTCEDELSGVAMCDPVEAVFRQEGREQAVAATVTDRAGNSAETLFSGINIDKTPPSAPAFSVGTHVTIDATSPSGANLSFTADAVDNLGSATVQCTHPSGTLFPIGTTVVACRALDQADNASSGSMVVTVLGAAEQFAGLIERVRPLHPSFEARLVASLRSAVEDARRSQMMCRSLQTLTTLVGAHRGRAVAADMADALIADANRIRAVLGCR